MQCAHNQQRRAESIQAVGQAAAAAHEVAQLARWQSGAGGAFSPLGALATGLPAPSPGVAARQSTVEGHSSVRYV
jgi:hypothetical protein